MIKYFVLFLILIGIVNVTIPNVSAMCVAGTLEWWESCNDTNFSDTATGITWIISIVIFTTIYAIVIVVRFKRRS